MPFLNGAYSNHITHRYLKLLLRNFQYQKASIPSVPCIGAAHFRPVAKLYHKRCSGLHSVKLLQR